MDHSKVVALLTVAVLASGCTGLRDNFQKALREEGLVNQGFPEAVWEEYDCDNQKLPYFVVERNELVPPRVKAGGEFNHRMVYVMCPESPTKVVAGDFATRIRFKGDPIVDATEPAYEILPGRWVVDSFVEIPASAEPGVYAYEIAFEGKGLVFEESLTFLVNAP